ncbi:MAG TPA: DUF5689 domain-containing protein [Flavobacterium sp.]|jgi:hypothetical protein|uniref:DUF5689 domain-containing protein n=1 Tax=Flavobacterium sp. TaxID=239 RepID=UPI002CFE0087|nr:DUF5689 domain-containing protein [Flavobacterium sp.]MCA0348531.1 DUF5689 domain-containing protein [Bacteroidota bacterium]HPW97254.1 DUF5689 domain-containing protein [Flavobacterium sp.]HQA73849.1 DUF5689 domain-containing protein [Flavobacterium sp.]
MKNLLKLLTITLFAALTSCVNSDDYGTPDLSGECSNLTATKNTPDILAMATSNIQQFGPAYDNDIIEAIVTSSDEGGNFYKSISLMSLDGTKGFSMPLDDYNLYTKYEPGSKVFIKLKGNFIQYNNTTSTVEIGSNYQGKVGRISGIFYKDVVKRSCEDNVGEDNIVNHITIAQANNNSYINKLVEFDNVQFTDASIGHTYFDKDLNPVSTFTATNHLIRDADGNKIIVRVSQYANFSGNQVPSGNGKIRGVLTKYNGDYQFMIRTEADVKLTNPRVLPFYLETFQTTFDDWTKYNVTGAQVWSLSDVGNPGKCADMNGFASGAQTNEDWLISPSLDLTSVSSAILSYQTAKNFTGNAIQVLISTNYVGSAAPSTATWTPLGGSIATASNFTWKDSGDVSLASYLNNSNVRIAFKYTSNTSGAAQWRVDNVRID